MKAHEKTLGFDLAELDDEAPVRKLVKVLLLLAIRDRATVLRFEHGKEQLILSYKVEGGFCEMVPPPLHLARRIFNIIRLIAHLDGAARSERGFGHVRMGEYFIHLFVDIRPNAFGVRADVALMHSPQAPEAARQVLADHMRPMSEPDGEMVIEFEDDAEGNFA